MLRAILPVVVIWALVMMTIQALLHSSGKDMLSLAKLIGLGVLGGTITSALIFLFVELF